MGYNLWFGEFDVSCPEERWTQPSAVLPNIEPVDPPYDSSGTGSRRSITFPGYIGWSEFARRHGLHDVFFGGTDHWHSDNALIANHPGAAPLSDEVLRRFEKALDEAPMAYEKAAAEYELWLELDRNEQYALPESETIPMFDTIRLNWLVYWTRFCLEHCEWPTFANS